MIINFLLIAFLLLILIACLFAMYFVGVLLWTKVPFVPSKKHVVTKMIQLAQLSTKSVVYDLGCGNGKILFAAERALKTTKHGAFTGYEINVSLIWYTRFLNFIRRTNIRFLCQNFFSADLSDADVIFMYLWPSVMEKFFATQWLNLKPGTKVISHAFKIKDLEPIQTIRVKTDVIYVYQR
jgi:SAM-dependent methyltransferase